MNDANAYIMFQSNFKNTHVEISIKTVIGTTQVANNTLLKPVTTICLPSRPTGLTHIASYDYTTYIFYLFNRHGLRCKYLYLKYA